jgi:heme/copper-type cytochrome/quinol oxidase subunit 1
VPLQIGARGLALPRLAQLSFWLYALGGIALYASFMYTPSEAGTTALAPLSAAGFTEGHGVDAWIGGVGLAILGFCCLAISLIVTITRHRAPGMFWRRTPLFTWSAITSSWVIAIAGPVMLAALTMLTLDRHFETAFFNSGEGGEPLLYAHLSWIFFTSVYVVMVISALGAISEIVSTFARKPPFSRTGTGGAMIAAAIIGPLAWMQNMYSDPIPVGFQYFAMLAALGLGVALGLILINLIATLWNGSITIRSPMLFALGAIVVLGAGLAGELLHSVVAVGRQTGNTPLAQGDTIYVVIGTAVLAGFGALYYWLPKISGRLASETAARISFWAIVAGTMLYVTAMQVAGLEGQPNDVYRFYGDEGLGAWNLIASLGAFLFVDGVLISVINFAWAARNGVEAGHDPWNGTTLEWYAPARPPVHNFDLIPDVRTDEPLLDIRAALKSPPAD